MFHYNLFSLNPNSCIPALVLSLMALACAPADSENEYLAGMNNAGQENDPNVPFPVPDAGAPESEPRDNQAGEEGQSNEDYGLGFAPCEDELISYMGTEICSDLDTLTYSDGVTITTPEVREAKECVSSEEFALRLENLLREQGSAFIDSDGNLTVKVTCTDADQDCHYQCEGWDLGDLQDPDDRRASIPVDYEPAPEEQNNGCFSFDYGSLNACNVELSTANSNESVIQYYSCANQGHAWLTQSLDPNQPYTLYVDLIDQSRGEPINSVALKDRPEQLACHLDNLGRLSLFFSLPSLNQSNPELYKLNSLMNTVEKLNLSELRGLNNYNFATEINEQSLKVYDDGLFTWSAQTDLQERVQLLYFAQSYAVTAITSDVTHEEALCVDHSDNNYCTSNRITPRLAQLDSLGQVFIQDSTVNANGEIEVDTYQLFEAQGPFQSISSSKNFLGLEPQTETVTELYFSLWGDPLPSENSNSLLGLPVVFSLGQWSGSYDQVELKSIAGNRALLRLRVRGEDNKFIWAVYHLLNDRLITLADLFTNEDLADSVGAEARWLTPKLTNNYILWPVNLNGALDASESDLRVFKIGLN